MELSLNLSYADGYKSRSQIARVITETWVSQNAYCPHCGCETLVKDVNNSPVLDFHCPICTPSEGKKKQIVPNKAMATNIKSTILYILISN